MHPEKCFQSNSKNCYMLESESDSNDLFLVIEQ